MELWISNNIALLIEILAVIFGVLYTVLMAKNKISCWIFGIIGSLLSVYLFLVYAKLYAEALLSVYYVFAGVYGWMVWKKQEVIEEVYQRKIMTHVKLVSVGIVLSFLMYFGLVYFFKEAQKPLIDSFTTIFSFIATYLMAKKWIENWFYWIVIDGVSVYLYFTRDLNIYALLMLVYTIIVVYGYFEWKKLKVIKVG
ncbi:nicotinamide mononucleotide transporter [Vicingus serpentipes]|uniref:Nicotinamide riboside transporter PnuC n=1 Tax=Vicingus serpentipes TaxID=1926625 RepID=A0A5C6RPX8_9FLAO|nr:nicotinamide riboside transporter PnuC [Vicingus serpentipes]TXB64263.1 nicotinamide mononucleotide transporter [Vicingus serpentipes]